MTVEKTTSVQQYIMIAVVVIAAIVLIAPKATTATPGVDKTTQLTAEIAKLKARCDKLEQEIAGVAAAPFPVCQCKPEVKAELPAPIEDKPKEVPAKPESVNCDGGKCSVNRPRLFSRLRLFKR